MRREEMSNPADKLALENPFNEKPSTSRYVLLAEQMDKLKRERRQRRIDIFFSYTFSGLIGTFCAIFIACAYMGLSIIY